MQRSALFLALLLALTSADAAPKNYGTITSRAGKTFYECKIVRVYPDGVGFTHKNGAAKLAFKELPASLQREFRYDPQAAAEYKREQAAARKAEEKRRQQQEIVMSERLMEAQMAEASYLAAAQSVYRAPTTTPSMSLALPGEQLPKTGYQTPSWVGTPITGPAIGGRDYRRSSYSYWNSFPFGYGGGYYPLGGYYPQYGYGYPYGGYYGAGYVNPTIYRSWNIGSGFRIGVGISPFGNVLRVFP